MDEKTPINADPQYEETTAPQNPPNAIVNPEARTGWLASSVGVLAIVFLIVGAAFTWVMVQRELGKGGRQPESAPVGTSGTEIRRDSSPGGFNPTPRPSDTREELEFRGGSDSISSARDLENAAAGSPVTLTGVAVDRTEGNTFWVRAGDDSVAVVVPGGTPTVRAGQRVNVSGTVETSGNAKRIRASRIDVK